MNALLLPILIIIGLNGLGFLNGYVRQTDKLTDFIYSLSFLVVAWVAYLMGGMTAPQIVLVLMITLWALRLGGYLFWRIHTFGRDKRFDQMRPNFIKLLGFWTLQTMSIMIIIAPSVIFLLLENMAHHWLMAIGGLVWLVGFVMETVADVQKFQFIKNPKNKKQWIDEGLWRYWQHPNYVGEILCWAGLTVFVLPVVMSFGFWYVILTIASPTWIYTLLRYISGVPLLEQSAEKKWGDNPEYQAYKQRTRRLL